jgi:hypothetical protein
MRILALVFVAVCLVCPLLAADDQAMVVQEINAMPMGTAQDNSVPKPQALPSIDKTTQISKPTDMSEWGCDSLQYDCGPTYYFQNPNSYGVIYFNTRFTTTHTDTLKAIDIAFYSGGSIGTADIHIIVCGSSNGFPDTTNVIYSTTIPYSSILWYPAWTSVSLPPGIVLPEGTDFHVVWQPVNISGGGMIAGLMDDASCGALRSSAYFPDSGWASTLGLFGEDHNWLSISARLSLIHWLVTNRRPTA